MEIKRIKIRAVGINAYRRYDTNNNEIDGYITGMFNVKPNDNLEFRLCYQITYDDYFVDYIPISEFKGIYVNYEIIN